MTARPVSCKYLALRYLKIHIVTTVRISKKVYNRIFKLSILCVFWYFSSISRSVPVEGLPFTLWRRNEEERARKRGPSPPTPAMVCLQLGSINPEELRPGTKNKRASVLVSQHPFANILLPTTCYFRIRFSFWHLA